MPIRLPTGRHEPGEAGHDHEVQRSAAHAYGLWDRGAAELSPQYPDVATERLHIDAATLHLESSARTRST